jgi:hypothetical protein
MMHRESISITRRNTTESRYTSPGVLAEHPKKTYNLCLALPIDDVILLMQMTLCETNRASSGQIG